MWWALVTWCVNGKGMLLLLLLQLRRRVGIGLALTGVRLSGLLLLCLLVLLGLLLLLLGLCVAQGTVHGLLIVWRGLRGIGCDGTVLHRGRMLRWSPLGLLPVVGHLEDVLAQRVQVSRSRDG